jgi:hypothetical protein
MVPDGVIRSSSGNFACSRHFKNASPVMVQACNRDDLKRDTENGHLATPINHLACSLGKPEP